jgi:hypothetical protein
MKSLEDLSDEELISLLRTSPDHTKRYHKYFTELIRRYETAKNGLGKVRDELENKKNECEDLKFEIEAYRDQTGD